MVSHFFMCGIFYGFKLPLLKKTNHTNYTTKAFQMTQIESCITCRALSGSQVQLNHISNRHTLALSLDSQNNHQQLQFFKKDAPTNILATYKISGNCHIIGYGWHPTDSILVLLLSDTSLIFLTSDLGEKNPNINTKTNKLSLSSSLKFDCAQWNVSLSFIGPLPRAPNQFIGNLPINPDILSPLAHSPQQTFVIAINFSNTIVKDEAGKDNIIECFVAQNEYAYWRKPFHLMNIQLASSLCHTLGGFAGSFADCMRQIEHALGQVKGCLQAAAKVYRPKIQQLFDLLSQQETQNDLVSNVNDVTWTGAANLRVATCLAAAIKARKPTGVLHQFLLEWTTPLHLSRMETLFQQFVSSTILVSSNMILPLTQSVIKIVSSWREFIKSYKFSLLKRKSTNEVVECMDLLLKEVTTMFDLTTQLIQSSLVCNSVLVPLVRQLGFWKTITRPAQDSTQGVARSQQAAELLDPQNATGDGVLNDRPPSDASVDSLYEMLMPMSDPQGTPYPINFGVFDLLLGVTEVHKLKSDDYLFLKFDAEKGNFTSCIKNCLAQYTKIQNLISSMS